MSKINPSTNSVSATVNAGAGTYGVTIDSSGYVWATDYADNSVAKIDASSNSVVATVGSFNGPAGIAADAYGNVWVANSNDNRVLKVNSSTNEIIDTINVGTSPFAWGDFTGFALQRIVLEFSMPDVVNPSVDTITPADDATGVAIDANLVINFTENVDVESGNIKLYKSDDTLIETFALPSAKVTGTGTDTITINPTSNLDENTSYYLQIDATAFDDSAGNSYAGIDSSTSWNFTTTDGNSPTNNGPTAEKFVEDIDSGFITVQGGNPGSTSKVTFNTNYTIIDGNAKVVIPGGTEMTDSEGTVMDLGELDLEIITEGLRSSYTSTISGAVDLRIPDTRLLFSQNIEITIPVGAEYDGQTLNVYYRNEGELNWNGGLSCTVSGGLCVFESNHATEYSAGDEPSIGNSDEEDIEVKNVKYSSEKDSITIRWETNRKADSKVKYGTKKSNLDMKEMDDKKEKKHKIVLRDLKPDTKYFFRVYSQKGNDNKDSSRIWSAKTSAIQQSNIESEAKTINRAYSGDAQPNACSYAVEEGDNLWVIAKKIYGDATAYPLIVEKNKEKYPGIENGKLSIGQELNFDCKNDDSVSSVPDQSLINQIASSPEPAKESKWWNPFSWF